MYSQLPILSKFIMPSKLYILPFIRATFALFSSIQNTHIFFLSFVTADGNKIPTGVNLQQTFLCFFSMFNILSLFIFISMGFNISCRSNFCQPLTITVSISSFNCFFLFVRITVNEKLCTFFFSYCWKASIDFCQLKI